MFRIKHNIINYRLSNKKQPTTRGENAIAPITTMFETQYTLFKFLLIFLHMDKSIVHIPSHHVMTRLYTTDLKGHCLVPNDNYNAYFSVHASEARVLFID